MTLERSEIKMVFFIFPYYKLYTAVAKIAYTVEKYNRIGCIVHGAKITHCQGVFATGYFHYEEITLWFFAVHYFVFSDDSLD